MVRCTIWYHLYNLKNVKNTHGGVLILVKSRNAPHIGTLESFIYTRKKKQAGSKSKINNTHRHCYVFITDSELVNFHWITLDNVLTEQTKISSK